MRITGRRFGGNEMNRVIVILTVLLLAIVVLVSCDDDSLPTIKSTEKRVDFPNKIGFRWTYAYYDSIAGSPDTVEVTIIGNETLENGEMAKIWRYEFRTKTKIRHVSIVGDTVKIYWNLLPDLLTFLYPLEVGSSWTSSTVASDTTTVLDGVGVSIPAGSFTDGYLITREWFGLEEYENSRIYIVNGVGLVLMHLKASAPMSGIDDVNEVWVLLDFDLVE
ncbi:MAG: hypothetical protein U9R56_00665 [candidate division Zixibacteria bacterium]|nr:hypothetical protein [candidate division Zixibacteria bacterium]